MAARGAGVLLAAGVVLDVVLVAHDVQVELEALVLVVDLLEDPPVDAVALGLDVRGREVSITDMFRLPTVRALAAHLEGNDTATAVADGLNRAKARRMMRTRAGLQPSAAA